MGEFGIVVIRACARLFPDGAAVAQLTVNQRVVGSNPTLSTIYWPVAKR